MLVGEDQPGHQVLDVPTIDAAPAAVGNDEAVRLAPVVEPAGGAFREKKCIEVDLDAELAEVSVEMARIRPN